MFDFTENAGTTPAKNEPRTLARELFASSTARLVLAASRVAGQDGVALIHALRDMILDPDVPASHWPLDEAIALLRRPPTRPDAQVDRLLRRLERIRDLVEIAAELSEAA